MSLTDPVSDFLTRVRNAISAQHQKVDVPHSKLKVEMARILKEEGYIANFKATEEEGRKVLRVYLKYSSDNSSPISDLKRISRPGCRVYVGHTEIPRVLGGLGISIIDHPAWRDDWSPGAQGRRRQRSPLRDLLDKPSAIGCQPSVVCR